MDLHDIVSVANVLNEQRGARQEQTNMTKTKQILNQKLAKFGFAKVVGKRMFNVI